MTLGHENAGTIITTLHIVRRPFGKDDDGVAQAGDARPIERRVVGDAGDVHVAQRHRRAVGKEDDGIAQAGDARPHVVVINGDGCVFISFY